MALNARQQLFVAHYLKTKNATESAKAAGYKEKSAHNQGLRMMKNEEVLGVIQSKLDQTTKKLGISAEKVLARISEFAFGIENCEPRDALKANELLGKHLKLFTDKLEIEESDSISAVLNRFKKHGK